MAKYRILKQRFLEGHLYTPINGVTPLVDLPDSYPAGVDMEPLDDGAKAAVEKLSKKMDVPYGQTFGQVQEVKPIAVRPYAEPAPEKPEVTVVEPAVVKPASILPPVGMHKGTDIALGKQPVK